MGGTCGRNVVQQRKLSTTQNDSDAIRQQIPETGWVQHNSFKVDTQKSSTHIPGWARVVAKSVADDGPDNIASVTVVNHNDVKDNISNIKAALQPASPRLGGSHPQPLPRIRSSPAKQVMDIRVNNGMFSQAHMMAAVETGIGHDVHVSSKALGSI